MVELPNTNRTQGKIYYSKYNETIVLIYAVLIVLFDYIILFQHLRIEYVILSYVNVTLEPADNSTYYKINFKNNLSKI